LAIDNLRYNEDSWKIDVISEICDYVKTKEILITRATGELTIKDANKFPDVILLGGDHGNIVLQGWELKMPETPITAKDPLIPAEQKARALGLNSFLVWNASEAALYLKDENDTFGIVCQWAITEIKSRVDVEEKRDLWISKLHEIIDSINVLLMGNTIKTVNVVDTINDSTYSQFTNDLSPHVQNMIERRCVEDRLFLAKVDRWWEYNELDYAKKSDKKQILSKIVIVNWMNRLLFAHYLKKYFKIAWKVDTISIGISVYDALNIFKEMSDICDYYNIFVESVGDDCLDEYSWASLMELNNFLKSVSIKEVSQENLQSMLVNVVSCSKRETAGQYCTPKELARLLVELVLINKKDTIMDPCCGTGTIVKEAQLLKKENGIRDYVNTVWASDKFSYPLKLASISLSDPDKIQEPIQVFEEDVFNLKVNQLIMLTDPKTGNKIERTLPVVGAMASNLPFVRFERVHDSNPDIKKVIKDKRSDLYANIALNLSHLLKENGRLGIIVSNSWLGTKWGLQFREKLLEQYELERLIISQSGKWFKNADVITNILILKKRSTPKFVTEITQYISIGERIEYWDNKNLFNRMVTDIFLNKTDSNSVYIHNYSYADAKEISSIGLGAMALFTDVSWFSSLKNKVIKVFNLFDIARGERRGWDKLFYPDGKNGIDEEYLRPVLLSSKEIKSLVAEPDGIAFCCSEGEIYLEEHEKKGTLRWISLFIDGVNEMGKLLPTVLARSNMKWYEMSDSKIADLAISMNPDKRPCVFRLKERSFVNQRLIRMTKKKDVDLDICHALMNSTLGILMIESQGFGRGLGVLDLNVNKMKDNYHMLDPTKISSSDKDNIVKLFGVLLKRDMKELPDELISEDRRSFDRAVLKAYNLEGLEESISNSLLEIYHIRKAIDVDITYITK